MKRAGRVSWAGAGDGSLLVAYSVPGGRCYFRKLLRGTGNRLPVA
jgi:hypothetical protein